MINIWCYWSQGEHNMPLLPKLCFENWKKHISNKFKINFIDKDIFLSEQNDIDENIFNKFTYQQQSDYVRLYLLYNYGGIYIDITCILRDNLKWITDKFDKGCDIVGFKVNYLFVKKNDYLMENWCIGVKNKNNYIIKEWKKVFHNLLCESYYNGGIDKSEIWIKTNKKSIFPSSRIYLSQHVAHLYCLQNNNKYFNLFKKTSYLYDAPSTALIAPFINFKMLFGSLFFGIGWNSNFPLIKITRHEKKIYLKYYCSYKLKNIINSELAYEYVKNDCVIQKILLIIFFMIIIKINIFK